MDLYSNKNIGTKKRDYYDIPKWINVSKFKEIKHLGGSLLAIRHSMYQKNVNYVSILF